MIPPAVRIVDQFSQLADVDFSSFASGQVAKWDGSKLVGANFVSSVNGRTGAVTLISGDVTGALGYTPENLSNKGAANGYAPLGSDSKINPAYLPAIAITDTSVVASQAAMLALTAQTGDIAIRSDVLKTFILKGADPTQLSNWEELLTPTGGVQSVNGRTGAVTLISGDITGALGYTPLNAASINTSLVNVSDNTDDIGSAAKRWKDSYFSGVVSAEKFKTSGLYLMASAGNGNTLAVIAGDLNTYRRLISAGFILGADDGGAADVAFVRADAGVARFSNASSGGCVLELGQVSTGGTVPSNSARIYAKDVSGTAEIFVLDEGGNETQISPHNEKGEWVFYSVNQKTGKGIKINMEALVRDYERRTKKKFSQTWREPKRRPGKKAH